MNSQMSKEEFRQLLEKAIADDKGAVAAILDLYEPMVIRCATENGILDEDVRQDILLQVLQDISKFKI